MEPKKDIYRVSQSLPFPYSSADSTRSKSNPPINMLRIPRNGKWECKNITLRADDWATLFLWVLVKAFLSKTSLHFIWRCRSSTGKVACCGMQMISGWLCSIPPFNIHWIAIWHCHFIPCTICLEATATISAPCGVICYFILLWGSSHLCAFGYCSTPILRCDRAI